VLSGAAAPLARAALHSGGGGAAAAEPSTLRAATAGAAVRVVLVVLVSARRDDMEAERARGGKLRLAGKLAFKSVRCDASFCFVTAPLLWQSRDADALR
jgi:hypothetical protein